MKCKAAINILAYLLFVFHGSFLLLWYLRFRFLGLELIVFLILLASSVGLIGRKEWGREGIIIGSGVGIGYYFLDFFVLTKSFDSILSLYTFILLLTFVFYMLPRVKRLYQYGFDKPQWNILVIDDDKTFLKLMYTDFMHKGIPILAAETGEEGLEIARKNRLDLIILDVILPGMKGRTVCSKLKEDNRTRDIPVLFLTAKNSQDDVLAEIKVGAVSHITKPINFQELYQEIEKILGK